MVWNLIGTGYKLVKATGGGGGNNSLLMPGSLQYSRTDNSNTTETQIHTFSNCNKHPEEIIIVIRDTNKNREIYLG